MDGKRSFQEIYERFQPGILRFLSRLVGEEEAEDVAQEVFLRVDRGLEGFRGESSIGTWIYRIARNAALDRLRSRPAWLESARQLQTHDSGEDPEDVISQIPDEGASLERYLIGKEMSECIRGRVDTLPESYRRVLVLSELVGMTNAEIASALGVSEGAVKIRLHRARALLREDLGTHCTLYHDELAELSCEPKPAFGSI
ncbi:MAG TPA: sigma-70 family RNA polymerase sigma factor [Candidatus Deferrimicrobiaceae bacterium]|nr:sigma-70 family RNA polymerase sigma factor [Candidatus Deferrimicrobiaceae bacterium]